ncbi:MAG TPA: adenylate/guanylate cyclase domain-containing protein, partial [Opitutaceae bacterium]|nr:adenylate/guanylate cyclase domain-containing protein [Opitutaceae bacterium]
LLATLLLVVAPIPLAAYLIVSYLGWHIAENQSLRELTDGARMFHRQIEDRTAALTHDANLLGDDYALKNTLGETSDPATLRSLLNNHRRRIDAAVMTLLGNDGALMADSRPGAPDIAPFRALMKQADAVGADSASGYAYLDGRLYSLVVVPLRAPDVIAWIGLGFSIDQAAADELKQTTHFEVSFIAIQGAGRFQVAESTLPPAQKAALQNSLGAGLASRSSGIRVIGLAGEDYFSKFDFYPDAGRPVAAIALQYPVREKLAPTRLVQDILLATFLAGAGIAGLAAALVARGVSRPVRELAAHTEVIARPDYQTKIQLDRRDELGQLATALNRMSDRLAEAELDRDLVNKGLSPQVAAEMRRHGELGGALREVTVLFADLRGFTALSERLPPDQLLGLLNRCFERLVPEIESRGGIVDKFVGDEIMALFGAPQPLAGAADQALQAALGLRRALAALNAEFAAEGRPAIACGIGLNTAQVIAGNVGTSARLNYTVIGDGVNLAKRIESATRELNADLLVSESTLRAARDRYAARDLGRITVKGRAAPVRVFTLEG